MHKLDRDPQPPLGLNRYQHGRDRWSIDSPTPQERDAIWAKLNTMQGERCAYCEASIERDNSHIEHFRQRGLYPQGTFDWNNLFGSCHRTDSCGKHKDNCGPYNHQHLIKPDVEDPEHFLVFTPDGGVHPRAGLSAGDHTRATETIRIFNLAGSLTRIRRSQVEGYVQTAELFAEMANNFPEDVWMPLWEEEVEKTALLPFATAIKHILTP